MQRAYPPHIRERHHHRQSSLESWKYVRAMEMQAVTLSKMTKTTNKIPYKVYCSRPHNVEKMQYNSTDMALQIIKKNNNKILFFIIRKELRQSHSGCKNNVILTSATLWIIKSQGVIILEIKPLSIGRMFAFSTLIFKSQDFTKNKLEFFQFFNFPKG